MLVASLPTLLLLSELWAGKNLALRFVSDTQLLRAGIAQLLL